MWVFPDNLINKFWLFCKEKKSVLVFSLCLFSWTVWHLIGKEHLIETTLFCDLDQIKIEAFADKRLVGLSFSATCSWRAANPFQ